MAIRPVVLCTDSRLRTHALQVTEFDETLRQQVQDLLDTVVHQGGGSLAAVQAGINLRIVVVSAGAADNAEPLVLVNPIIIAKTGRQEFKEGCYSIPGSYITIERAEQVVVQAQDLEGQTREMTASGWLAAALQHSMGYLDGVLPIDSIASEFKRRLILDKVRKTRR